MSSEKAGFFFHVYFHYENKKKHVGDAKFGNDAMLADFSPTRPPRALREDILGKNIVII
jgi:hypothetical protein